MGLVIADIIGSFILWLRVNGKTKIGDNVEISKVTGIVKAVNMHSLVVEHSNKTHTIVPLALAKSVTVLGKADAKTDPPKPPATPHSTP